MEIVNSIHRNRVSEELVDSFSPPSSDRRRVDSPKGTSTGVSSTPVPIMNWTTTEGGT